MVLYKHEVSGKTMSGDRSKKKTNKKSKEANDSEDETEDETEDSEDSEDGDSTDEDGSNGEDSDEEAADATDAEEANNETEEEGANDKGDDKTNRVTDNIRRASTKIPPAKKKAPSVSFHSVVLLVLIHCDSTHSTALLGPS